MKKFLFSAIVAVMAILPASMLADDNKDNQQPQREQREGRANRQGFNPMEGIELTAQQQEAFKALRLKNQQANKAENKACTEESCKKGECKDCSKDKCTCKPDPKARMQAMRERRAAHLAEIKKILTPEQYTQFLENHFLNSGNDRQGAMQKNSKKGNKPGKKGKK